MSFRKLYTIFIFLFLCISIYAQDEEQILETEVESDDVTELAESLEELRKNPTELNNASSSELELVPAIDAFIAQKIIEYRKKQPFSSISELRSIEGITEKKYKEIKPYVTVGKVTEKFKLEYRGRASQKLEKSIAFKEKKYYDSPAKVYNRTNLTLFEKLTFGVLIEKDSGEKNFIDFYVSYIEAKNLPFLPKIVIGNYGLEFAQGLSLWGPYGLGKGSDVIYSVKKKPKEIKTYKTADENASLFGIAVQESFKNILFYVFYSKTSLDANVQSDSILSFYKSGFHRNKTESKKKNTANETLVGSRIELNLYGRFGVSYYESKYSGRIIPDNPVGKFSGKSNTIISGDYEFTIKNINLFGEIARSKSGGTGFVGGGIFGFGDLRSSLLIRNYEIDFYSLHGYAFGDDNGSQNNEKGIYLGILYQPFSQTDINFYFDQFYHPYQTNVNPLSSGGNEIMLQVSQELGDDITSTLKFKSKTQDVITKVTDIHDRERSLSDIRKQRNFRIQLDYSIFKVLTLRSRFEFSNVSYNLRENKNGILFYQDLKMELLKNLFFKGRISFFETDDFESRIYEFENDLPGILSNSAFYGKGRRWYVIISYQPTKWLDIGLKYSDFYRDDVDKLGSGIDSIDTNNSHIISLQVDMNI